MSVCFSYVFFPLGDQTFGNNDQNWNIFTDYIFHYAVGHHQAKLSVTETQPIVKNF